MTQHELEQALAQLKAKHEAVLNEYAKKLEELAHYRHQLSVVKMDTEGTFIWQPADGIMPTGLVCPVVMAGPTFEALVKALQVFAQLSTEDVVALGLEQAVLDARHALGV